MRFDFAYRTFKWDSESTDKAAVHCVIIGFSCHTDLESANAASLKAEGKSLDFPNPCDISKTVVISSTVEKSTKIIFDSDGSAHEAKNINPYLIDAPNIFVESRRSPICAVPEIVYGNKVVDGGFLYLDENEKAELLKETPKAKEIVKRFVSSEDFINDKVRYCLWLTDEQLPDFSKSKIIAQRLAKCREFREQSKQAQAHAAAETPHLFSSPRQPDSDYLLIPVVSSENRKYVPIGYVSKDVIASNACFTLPNASLYVFGILNSIVHNAWMRVVCGRLKSDYRYSNTIVYNNFPFPSPTEEQSMAIEKTAQAILDARKKYENKTLGEMYSKMRDFYPELNKAHRANDQAVLAAYGWAKDITETEIVSNLMQLYQAMVK